MIRFGFPRFFSHPARGISREDAINEQRNESRAGNGIKNRKEPSKFRIAREESFGVNDRHELLHTELCHCPLDIAHAFFQLGLQPKTSQQPYQREGAKKSQDRDFEDECAVDGVEQRQNARRDDRINVRKGETLVFNVARILPLLLKDGQ